MGIQMDWWSSTVLLKLRHLPKLVDEGSGVIWTILSSRYPKKKKWKQIQKLSSKKKEEKEPRVRQPNGDWNQCRIKWQVPASSDEPDESHIFEHPQPNVHWDHLFYPYKQLDGTNNTSSQFYSSYKLPKFQRLLKTNPSLSLSTSFRLILENQPNQTPLSFSFPFFFFLFFLNVKFKSIFKTS